MAMVPRMTWAICCLASAITLVLGYSSTAGPGAGDALVVAYVLGPYLLLGLFAWWHRGKSIVSWLLLALTVLLATWGVCLFGLDSHWYHTDWQYRMTMRLTVLLVPLLQWAAGLVVVLVLFFAGELGRQADDVPASRG
jgi:uncharacterized membrane protein